MLCCSVSQGANRPSAREITLALLNKPYFKATSSFNSSYLLTAMGQLVGELASKHGVSCGLSLHRRQLRHAAPMFLNT